MNARLLFTLSAPIVMSMVGCSGGSEFAKVGDYQITTFNGQPSKAGQSSMQSEFVVKTTAYTHLEADSLPYGTKNAYGTNLKYGDSVRSAAADWSRYPVGTVFKIKGLPYNYVVDDYGSALVGTDTIDLYKPNHAAMNAWGSRKVGIEVLQWGSYDKSLEILDGRKGKASHVDKMLGDLKGKIGKVPSELRNGFRPS